MTYPGVGGVQRGTLAHLALVVEVVDADERLGDLGVEDVGGVDDGGDALALQHAAQVVPDRVLELRQRLARRRRALALRQRAAARKAQRDLAKPLAVAGGGGGGCGRLLLLALSQGKHKENSHYNSNAIRLYSNNIKCEFRFE